MAIITISRGTFAGGARLASILGARPGYRVVSREQLYERARVVYGISVEEFVGLMERAPSALHRGARQSRRLLVALQATMCELVLDDNVIYHGHSGHLFLPDVAHVVRVRLIAPRGVRVEMAMQREGISEYEANVKIDQVDAERTRWSLFFYGHQWGDPAQYDVTLNLDRMSVEDAAVIVGDMTMLPPFQTTEASRRRLRDVALESLVKARLMFDPVMGGADVEVEARDGHVRLIGVAGEQHALWAKEQVGRLPGVAHVDAGPALRGAGGA